VEEEEKNASEISNLEDLPEEEGPVGQLQEQEKIQVTSDIHSENLET